MDGRLLARARAQKEDMRRRAMAEDERRRTVAYARVPELRTIDSRLVALMGEVVSAAMGQGRPMEEIKAESLDIQSRRAEILEENGWPMDWLDGAWSCPRCRDTGYVESRPCDCLLKLYEQERTKDLSALLKLGNESFETFDLTYYEDQFDPDTRVSPRKHMKTVLDFCRDYANDFGKNADNLLFWGGTGLGKTFLSACIARVVSRKGYSVVYETVVEALAAFENQKFRDGQDDADARVARMLSCDLLILDDLGTEMITEFSKSAVYMLINSRLLSGKKTIISTNLSPDKIETTYTPQIASRLAGEYQELPFVGRDIRILRKERGLG